MKIIRCMNCGATLEGAVATVDHYTKVNTESPCERRRRRQRERAR